MIAQPLPPRRGLDYDDPVPDVIVITGLLTPDVARRLADEGVSGVKVEGSVPPDGLAHLAAVPSLRRLDLSGCDLKDQHVAFLEAMPWLTAVSLASCGGITDAAVAYLQHHQALEQINLQWTLTGDASLAALTGKPALARVVLGNRVTDDGIASLRDFPALAAPGAWDTFLSIKSARALTDRALAYIGELNGVAALDVHMSAFGSPHYTDRGVAHLRRMTSLEELNFHGVLATDAVLREIAGIPRLRSLHCQDPASGDEGFIALGTCTTLESLATRVCRRITGRGLAAIARLPRLTRLTIGGPRVSDDAWASLAAAPTLFDLCPILSRDEAFEHIALIPRLERLTNMYNRATTDAATRHLRDHAKLAYYSAFGTQITDESLAVLATIPTLETVECENCGGITDTGMRLLTQLPQVRRLTIWSCVKVTGTWTEAARPTTHATSQPGQPEQFLGYQAETLMDYPDLPVPADADRPMGDRAGGGLLSTLACFGVHGVFVDEGLRLSVEPGIDTRWVGALTPDAFAVPLTIELVVRPITALRMRFGTHHSLLTFDGRGSLVNTAPWFLRLESQQGQSHGGGDATPMAPDAWARIRLETGSQERRMFVNGELRHSWKDDFTHIRSRIGIGLRESTLNVRELRVESVFRSGHA